VLYSKQWCESEAARDRLAVFSMAPAAKKLYKALRSLIISSVHALSLFFLSTEISLGDMFCSVSSGELSRNTVKSSTTH